MEKAYLLRINIYFLNRIHSKKITIHFLIQHMYVMTIIDHFVFSQNNEAQ